MWRQTRLGNAGSNLYMDSVTPSGQNRIETRGKITDDHVAAYIRYSIKFGVSSVISVSSLRDIFSRSLLLGILHLMFSSVENKVEDSICFRHLQRLNVCELSTDLSITLFRCDSVIVVLNVICITIIEVCTLLRSWYLLPVLKTFGLARPSA